MPNRDETTNVVRSSRHRALLILLGCVLILGLLSAIIYGNGRSEGVELMEPAPGGIEEIPTNR